MHNFSVSGQPNPVQPSAPLESDISNGRGGLVQAQNSFQTANRSIAIAGGSNVRPPSFNPNYRFSAATHGLQASETAEGERPSKMPRY